MFQMRRASACVLMIAVLLVTVDAAAGGSQGTDDLVTLKTQIDQLNHQGKYVEAIQIAEHYLSLVRQRYGEQHAEFAALDVGFLECPAGC
jgi:hypothetical protein